MSKPMSDERLVEIKADYQWLSKAIEEGEYEDSATDLWRSWRGDFLALIEEVDRLRQEGER